MRDKEGQRDDRSTLHRRPNTPLPPPELLLLWRAPLSLDHIDWHWRNGATSSQNKRISDSPWGAAAQSLSFKNVVSAWSVQGNSSTEKRFTLNGHTTDSCGSDWCSFISHRTIPVLIHLVSRWYTIRWGSYISHRNTSASAGPLDKGHRKRAAGLSILD